MTFPEHRRKKDNALAKCRLGLRAWRAKKKKQGSAFTPLPMKTAILGKRRLIRQGIMSVLGYNLSGSRRRPEAPLL